MSEIKGSYLQVVEFIRIPIGYLYRLFTFSTEFVMNLVNNSEQRTGCYNKIGMLLAISYTEDNTSLTNPRTKQAEKKFSSHKLGGKYTQNM